jgi:Zn-finger nucleic acid-binding protein
MSYSAPEKDMKCPNCSDEMKSMTVEAHLSAPETIDLCPACQGFWFDKYEDLKLAPASTLNLVKLIGENTSTPPVMKGTLQCPRCQGQLLMTHDMQRSTKFSYWRCPNKHGRFIGFLDFLREKNFIRPLTAAEVTDLSKKIPTVSCSHCGAAIDLGKETVCSHCGSPLSILDMNQPQQTLNQLKQAAAPRSPDPSLPFQLEMEKRRIENIFGPTPDPDWITDASANGLIRAGLNAFTRWLNKSEA